MEQMKAYYWVTVTMVMQVTYQGSLCLTSCFIMEDSFQGSADSPGEATCRLGLISKKRKKLWN